eukprot:9497369-Pyramimonas_sp.AAC.1
MRQILRAPGRRNSPEEGEGGGRSRRRRSRRRSRMRGVGRSRALISTVLSNAHHGFRDGEKLGIGGPNRWEEQDKGKLEEEKRS